MKITFSRKNTMAALLLAAATVGLPTTSYADPAKSHRYQDCKESDREGQLIGGLVGAVAGGVAGREVAGRGDRTEGAAIGAAVGALAGAAIADKDCRNPYRRTNSYDRRGSYGYNNTNYRRDTYRTGSSYGYGRSGPNPRGVARGNPHVHGHRHQGSRWGFSNRHRDWRRNETLKDRIKWEMEELRREREYLIDKRRYVRYDRDLDRRLRRIGDELEHLKRELRYVKKGLSYRDYDRIRYRTNDRYYDSNYRDYRRDNYYYKTKR